MTKTSTRPTLSVRRGDPGAVLDMLSLPGALMEGHFELLSGLHSDRFLAFSRIASEPDCTDLLSRWLAPSLEPLRPALVIAPSTAGVGLGWALAQRLGAVLQLATLGEDGRPEGLLGEERLDGRSVLLVNDVVTTGDGLAALADLVRGRGGRVCGAAWFLSRSLADVGGRISAPTELIGSLQLETWKPEECPLCAASVEATRAVDLN